MHKINWWLVGIMGFVSLLILFGTGMLMGDYWRYRDWGMIGPNGMVENWGYSYPPAPLGWIGMIFMSLIPAGLMVLAVFGIAWLVRNVSNSRPPSS
jgi:hypothetical protein